MKWTLAATATAIGLVIGCGAARPPNQLLDARTAYQKATADPGASMATASMLEAKQALDAAEQAYQKGEINKAKNLAYIAHRKALAAEAKAETLRAVETKRVALADFQHFREMQAIAARERLERAKGAIANAQKEAEAQRQAREAAEAKLTQIEGVQAQKTEKGLVLTVSGNTLFKGDKTELSTAGKERLGEIAKALKDDKRTVLVVGHTDGHAKRETSDKISEARANAVRSYLVTEGIDEDRVRSEGMGATMPVAENKTAEGRASNRRVEIILEASPGSGHTEMPKEETGKKAKPAPKKEQHKKKERPEKIE